MTTPWLPPEPGGEYWWVGLVLCSPLPFLGGADSERGTTHRAEDQPWCSAFHTQQTQHKGSNFRRVNGRHIGQTLEYP